MKLTKKMIITGAAVVGAIGIGTAAFAFIKASGSGQGTATVATTVIGVDLKGELPTVLNLVPGVPVPITVKAKNSNGFTATLGAIGGAVTGVTTDTLGVDNSVCKFEIVAEPSAATHAVPSSAAFATLTGTEVFLLMRSSAVDQTACLTATVDFDLTA